jgi:starch-binding outer membrane protein, SusD/RagB family
LLLFVASQLFNSDKPYAEGEAAEKKMVWFGNYDKNRWKLAMDAGKAFFDALKTNGYYHLVQKEEVTPSDYRYAFRAAYFDRGTTETLISVRRDIFTINMSTPEGQAMRWGGYCPTKEYFDMFPMANGEVKGLLGCRQCVFLSHDVGCIQRCGQKDI